jgi:hypothetical protein
VATRSDVGLPKATVLKVPAAVFLLDNSGRSVEQNAVPSHPQANFSLVYNFASQDTSSPALLTLQTHFACIVPEALVEAEVAMFTAEHEETLLEGNPDFVVDAIDDIDTKVINSTMGAPRLDGLHSDWQRSWIEFLQSFVKGI